MRVTDSGLQWLVKGCCVTSIEVRGSHAQAHISSVFTLLSVFFFRLETSDHFAVSIVLCFVDQV